MGEHDFEFDPRVLSIEEEYQKSVQQRDEDYEAYLEEGRIWGLVPKSRITKIKFPRISKEIVDGYLSLQDMTTSVSDVLDSFGINGMVPTSYCKPVVTGKKIAGTAITIRNLPERKTPTQGYIDKELIKMSTRDIYYFCEKGDVLVSDFGGNLEASNMGGMSCLVAKTRGLAGNIVYGSCRDVSSIREIDYPVWSCGTTQITGKFRVECMEMNGSIQLCGKRVDAGDLIVADDSGICIVPADLAEEVLNQCLKIAESEQFMEDLVRRDVPLKDLRPYFRKRYK